MNLPIAIFIFATIFSGLGSNVLAAHQLAFQVFVTSFIIPKGFSTATTIIVSSLIGEKKYNLILPMLLKVSLLSLLIVCCFNGLVYVFSDAIVSIFIPHNLSIIDSASSAVRLVCISQLFFSVYMVFLGALTARKDTRFLMYAEFVTEYVMFIPLAFLLAVKLNLGVVGGYIAFLAWAALDALVLISRFMTKNNSEDHIVPAIKITSPKIGNLASRERLFKQVTIPDYRRATKNN